MIKYTGKIFLLLFGSLIAQMATSFLLPKPFSFISIPALVILLVLFLKESQRVLWFALGLFFLLELYESFPFGILLISGFVASVLVVWLYQVFVTNRSAYAAVLLVMTFILLQRAVQLFLIGLLEGTSAIAWRLVFISTVWQILLSSALLLGVYLLFARYTKQLGVHV